MRILIAEDQPELRRMLVKNLTAAGYTVDGVPDGAEALAYLDAAAYDAAVLDIMMPKVDGLTVLRTLRARGSALPVLLLTARDAVADRVDGLDAGADDYLIKPFAMDELLARLRVLTRKKGSGSTNVYTLADLTVDTAARTAKRGDRTLELSAREYALLEYLIRSKGVVLSRQQTKCPARPSAGGTSCSRPVYQKTAALTTLTPSAWAGRRRPHRCTSGSDNPRYTPPPPRSAGR